MDLEDRCYEERIGAYRLIRLVNRYLFGTRVILTHLENYSKPWKQETTIRILDVGSGASDIPQAIVDWARKKGWRVHVVALDICPKALSFAKSECAGYPEISFVRASTFALPFPPQSFDYIISSMFFHHLSDDEIVRVLKVFDAHAVRGIIVNDLARNLRAWLWIFFFTRFIRNKMFRNDAPLSVLRGFKKHEVDALIRETGLNYLRFHPHIGHRFAIAGEKGV